MTNSLDSPDPRPRQPVVLLPCHTLEDFPRDRPGGDAGALLNAWSVIWHPQILAITGQMPAWHPIESPPDDLSNLTIVLTASDQTKLPARASAEGDPNATSQIILVANEARSEIARKILVDPVIDSDRIEDFYALAYAYLQVQLMTRQLRYSSNLDDDYFTEQLLAAAATWDSDDGKCTDALHNCFDLLAQERDHAFSADPYLLDLTLLADTTLGDELTRTIESPRPTNLLANADLLEQLKNQNPAAFESLREKVRAGDISVAGGTLNDEAALDLMTFSSAIDYLSRSRDRYVDLLGTPPAAFGRFTGGLPGDLPVLLRQLGYEGAIFADFATGSDVSQDEAKLMWQSGDAEVQAICSTPLDASDPNVFLDLGPRLGEAADAGQIATALLVHWPGNECFAYQDLRRVALWGLALGKFQSLDQYFDEGERPYHSFSPGAGTGGADWLTQRVQAGVDDTLSSQARQTRVGLEHETASAMLALAQVASGAATADAASTIHDASRVLCDALGIQPAENGSSIAIVNPHATAHRRHVAFAGNPPEKGEHIYASHAASDGSVAVIDTPGCGFTIATPGPRAAQRKWFSRNKTLADAEGLRNDFFEATLNEDTGGILSVHTDGTRSNRFSWQLVHASQNASGEGCSSMRLVRSRVTIATTTTGEIRNDVEILDAAGETAATASLTYRIELGSRFLYIDADVDPKQSLTDTPWHSYFAGRVAWAMEAAVPHLILRDQIVPAVARQLIAPSGVWIDEAGSSMLVLADGMPAHRRIGQHMLDSLLIVQGESARKFRLSYGFDIPAPVAASRSALAPPTIYHCDPPAGPSSGWLFHVDAPGVVATDWTAVKTGDHPELTVRVIETRGKSTTANLSAFRDIASAAIVDYTGKIQRELEPSGDAVSITLAEHQVAIVRLSF